MDKKKTGNLIREARQRKNYTQSELGTLIGVTNKAISRWENGESFPDIGVLEALAEVLDLPIQDIVTGESAADQGKAVTEVVRLAKLQEQKKREKRNLYVIMLGSLAFDCLIGICVFSGGMAASRYGACRISCILLAVSLAMLGLLYRYSGRGQAVKIISSNKLSRWLEAAVFVTLLWSVGIVYLSFGMIREGKNPFGMEPVFLGPFLTRQLQVAFALNIVFLAREMYRMIMGKAELHLGCAISQLVVCLNPFYVDIFYGMDTLDSARRIMDRGTVLISLEAVAGFLFLFIWFRRSHSHACDSPRRSQ